jgi:hypothetical protein
VQQQRQVVRREAGERRISDVLVNESVEEEEKEEEEEEEEEQDEVD